MVFQDRWSLGTGSITLKCGTFCLEYVALQDRWSLMGVVSQDWFHCSSKMNLWLMQLNSVDTVCCDADTARCSIMWSDIMVFAHTIRYYPLALHQPLCDPRSGPLMSMVVGQRSEYCGRKWRTTFWSCRLLRLEIGKRVISNFNGTSTPKGSYMPKHARDRYDWLEKDGGGEQTNWRYGAVMSCQFEVLNVGKVLKKYQFS